MAIINEYYPERVTHPGEILLEALEEREIGAKEFSVRTGKPEKTITAVLKGDSSITPDMAVLFEQVLAIPAHFWLKAQRNFDEYQAKTAFQETIEEAIEWAKSFQYSKMANLGWVPKTSKNHEKVIALFEYFRVASLKGWNDYYLNQKLQVAFRISLKNNKNATSIAAWLRQGEIQAKQLDAPIFNKTLLKQNLSVLKQLMATQPTNFFEELQAICLAAGVKVVHTPSLPKTAIHGSTRWINDVPLVQLSNRYKRNDIFWFTFFHELGHILEHGKKYISLENIEYEGENEIYENEANEFASNLILTPSQLNEIWGTPDLNYNIIIDFSKKFITHPACIIGRLQHLGYIRYGFGNHFFEPIEFKK